MQKIFFISLISVILIGCASVYKTPQSSERAQFRIVAKQPTKSLHSILFGAYTNSDCNPANGGRIAFLNSFIGPPPKPNSLGMPGAENVSEKLKYELEIAANQPFTFIAQEQGEQGTRTVESGVLTYYVESCAATASFIPKANKKYEAYYSYSYASRQCRIELNEIQSTPNGIKKIPIEFLPLKCKYPGEW